MSEQSERKARVRQRAQRAIEALAASDLAAAASILRVGRIEVRDDDSVPTAALQLERGFYQERFRIVLNAEFCDLPVHKLSAILLHELLHHVMRHLEGEQLGPDRHRCNVVQDAFINRTIFLANRPLSAFMREYYPADEMPALLLRPDSAPPEEHGDVYRALYSGQLTEHDLYEYLADTTPEEIMQVQLLGSHEDGEEESERPAISIDQAARIVDELQQALERQDSGQEAGRWSEMQREIVRLQANRKRDEVEQAFRAALCQHCGRAPSARGRVEGEQRRPLMPERPQRADVYSILAGVDLQLWRHPTTGNQGGTAVYLDVSGSMGDVLELVYSSCVALDYLLAPEFYLFSNIVVTITLDELRAGTVHTTGGTDFDPVVEHLLERPHLSRAVLFTDGYASLGSDYQQRLRGSGQELVGVLSPGGSDRYLDFCSQLFRMPDVSADIPGTSGSRGLPRHSW